VHDGALRRVPNGIHADVERRDGGVDKGVGCLDHDLGAEGAEVFLGGGEDSGEIAGAVGGSQRNGGGFAIDAGTVGGDVAISPELFCHGGRGEIGNALEGEVEGRGVGGGRNDDPRGNDSQRRRGRGWAGGGEQGVGRGPLAGVGEGQKRVGRHEAGDSRGFGSQRKCTGGGRAEGESVVLARLRFELEYCPIGTASVPMSPSRAPRLPLSPP